MVTLSIRTVTKAFDLTEFVEPGPAVGAPAEMGTHPGGVARCEPAAQLAAEPVAGPPAFRLLGDGDVLLQVEAAQAFTGPVCEHRHGVGRHPQPVGDLGWRAALHFGLPEHVAPAGG